MRPDKLQAAVIALLLFSAASTALAPPLEFSELSLLVRAHESDASIAETAS